jgi:hypothetical protein
MMSSFENKLRTWKISLAPNEEQRNLADQRKKICQECESCKEFTNQLLKKIIDYYCGECNCPIGKKIYSITESCPKNKWSN